MYELIKSFSRCEMALSVNLDVMKGLPQDIIVVVLSKLPVRTLLRFRCVCKRWCCIISDPGFNSERRNCRLLVASDIGKYIIDDESSISGNISERPGFPNYRFVTNSCDGFVIIAIDESLFLFNPCTRYSKHVLEISDLRIGDRYDNISSFTFGFFHDAYANDYKVIVARYPLDSAVLCASLKLQMWKKVEGVEQQFDTSTLISGPVVNGRMHWAAFEVVKKRSSVTTSYVTKYSTPKREIIWFDAGKEVFTVLPSPNPQNVDENAIVGLGVLSGCLSMSRVNSDKSVEVLMMKEYGVAESWTSMFVVPNAYVNPFHGDFTPLLVKRNGDIIVRIDRGVISVYIVSKGWINNVGFPIMFTNTLHAVPFEESLASPLPGMGA